MKTFHISRRLRRFIKANEAVSALEYAVLVGVVMVGVGGAVLAFSDDVSEAITGIGDTVKTTGSGITTQTGAAPTP